MTNNIEFLVDSTLELPNIDKLILLESIYNRAKNGDLNRITGSKKFPVRRFFDVDNQGETVFPESMHMPGPESARVMNTANLLGLIIAESMAPAEVNAWADFRSKK